jgi:phosphatidylserine synthase
MEPGLIKGETDGLALFSQYNPHGIFIAFEDLGYLMMSLALLFAAPVFARGERLERSIQRIFIGSPLVAFAAFIGLYLIYGNELDYRFEVTVITITWFTLIASGVLLGILFRREDRP